MVKVFPFKGITYNKKKVSKLDRVMAPPYDVISKEEQDHLYDLHDYNIIRLILGKDFPEDTEFNNKYVRAANFFEGLLRHEILIRDEKPCIYAYEQSFKVKGKTYARLGFISLLRLEDLGKGKVFPHEETLPKPKADRLHLMLQTKSHFESVFSIFHDKNNRLYKILKKLTRRKPYIEARDKDNNIHRLWKIDKKGSIHKIMREMKEKWIFIADGHHRYEASLKLKDELKDRTQKFHEEEPYNHTLVFFTPIENKGLVILPIHRAIKLHSPLFDPILFTQELSEHFEVEEITFTGRSEKKQKARFFKLMDKKGRNGHTFGMFMGGNKFYLLTLKNENIVDEFITENKPRQWKHLDVTILHSLVIDRLLHIQRGTPESEQSITYFKDEDQTLQAVKNGQAQIAFFLNPTKIDEVVQIASKYEKMPPKSTFFYPKLLSGLVMNKIDNESKVDY